MRISIIAAISDNNVIGNKGGIPWRLPNDFINFKKVTKGHHVIMGRNTWDSIGKPLPSRTNIVVTTKRGYIDNLGYLPGVARDTHSLKSALSIAKSSGEDEVFIIGGVRLYEEAVKFCDRFYLTTVHSDFEGDTYFPRWKESEWKSIDCTRMTADEKHCCDYTIEILKRRKSL